MSARKGPGLTAQVKERLIRQVMERRLRRSEPASAARGEEAPSAATDARQRWEEHPGFRQLEIMREGGEMLGIANPYFRSHEGVAGAKTLIDGREYVNFSSYNYLGLNGDPRVGAAAKAAIDRYGTSVSASRPVSGERPDFIRAEILQRIA